MDAVVTGAWALSGRPTPASINKQALESGGVLIISMISSGAGL